MRQRASVASEAGLKTVRRRSGSTERHEELLARVSHVFFSQGFTAVSMDQLAEQLSCSKTTLYALAPSKAELVLRVAKRFFAASAHRIEAEVIAEDDPAVRITTYLAGIGLAMGTMSDRFYDDMVSYQPTAVLYASNSDAAASRVQELIADGVAVGAFRSVHGAFTSKLVAMAIEGIHSGVLLRDTDLSPGQAFSELGDVLLKGLHN